MGLQVIVVLGFCSDKYTTSVYLIMKILHSIIDLFAHNLQCSPFNTTVS